MNIAFIGFRHGHIMGLYHAALKHPGVKVVAAVEEDASAAAGLKDKVALTHTRMTDALPLCDAVAVGDYFSKRGSVILAALAAGKHVISDKPICTLTAELDQIEQLAGSKKLVVSALFDLRDCGAFRTARRLIRDGTIGQVHTINFTAQHPLLRATRPSWYFEPGKQGGTLNDIACHATDLIPWMTGRQIDSVVAARAWNARLPEFPHFHDAAQFMLKLDNNGGVLGDVSYLAPDAAGYSAPQYWRVTCHGSSGCIEARYAARELLLATSTDKSFRTIPADDDIPDGRLTSFLNNVAGEEYDLTTADVIRASRMALKIQESAR
jgi:predicted dehydrogenase